MNIYLTKIISLLGLMLLTRFHHFGDALSLPDASLAVLFLAGLWIANWRFFVLLLIEAGLIDYIAMTQLGVSDYCISPAYVFLIPTYACLWMAGRYCIKFQSLKLIDLIAQLSILFIATSLAFVISNASFYPLSGKFSEMDWLEYISRVKQYYFPYTYSAIVYVTVILGSLRVIKSLRLKTPSSAG